MRDIQIQIPVLTNSEDLAGPTMEGVAAAYTALNAFPTKDGSRVILALGNYPSSYQTVVDPDTAEAFAIKIIQAAHIAAKIRHNAKEEA